MQSGRALNKLYLSSISRDSNVISSGATKIAGFVMSLWNFERVLIAPGIMLNPIALRLNIAPDSIVSCRPIACPK